MSDDFVYRVSTPSGLRVLSGSDFQITSSGVLLVASGDLLVEAFSPTGWLSVTEGLAGDEPVYRLANP